MIKVLFVCHGNRSAKMHSQRKSCQNGANCGSGNGIYTVLTTIQLHPILWHCVVGGKLRQNVAFKGQ